VGDHYYCDRSDWLLCNLRRRYIDGTEDVTMKIFVYVNKRRNSCHGDYYFIANDERQAATMATYFAKEHNNKVKRNINYTIDWESDVKEYEVKPGFLPLNRITLDVEK